MCEKKKPSWFITPRFLRVLKTGNSIFKLVAAQCLYMLYQCLKHTHTHWKNYVYQSIFRCNDYNYSNVHIYYIWGYFFVIVIFFNWSTFAFTRIFSFIKIWVIQRNSIVYVIDWVALKCIYNVLNPFQSNTFYQDTLFTLLTSIEETIPRAR